MAGDLEAIARLGEARKKLKEEIAKVIIGQEQIVDDLLTALFARGHCLMIGVPGLAKTLMVRTIAQAIDLEFNRIQFTPDLMPSDITGTEIIEEDRSTRRPAVPLRQGAGLRQHPARRRDQPHAAQDAGRPAPGDAGAAGHRRRAGPTICPGRSSCWRRRTRSSRKAPIRCPKRSSTASCSTSASAIPKPQEELEIAKSTTADVAVDVAKVLTGPEINQLAADRPQAAGERPRRACMP